jgi:hypothetical protein
MKIAVMAGLLAKGDVNVNTCHGAKVSQFWAFMNNHDLSVVILLSHLPP